jgi:hypothetical protein
MATSPLVISDPSFYYVQAPIGETFTVTNESDASLTISELFLAVRDPSGANYDQLCTTNLTLAAGQSYTCNLQNAWDSPGTYTVWPDWKDTSGNFHALGPNQTFTLTTTTKLIITAPHGYHVNKPIHEKFTVTDESDASLTISELFLAVRDPSGTNYDQLCTTNLTLAAGRSHTCKLRNAWASPGTYTVWPDWKDTSGDFHALGPNQTFKLS